MTAEPSTELRPPSGEAFDPSLVEGMIRVIARMEVVNPESRPAPRFDELFCLRFGRFWRHKNLVEKNRVGVVGVKVYFFFRSQRLIQAKPNDWGFVLLKTTKLRKITT